ncbi:hypothetical protein PRUPE_6G015800 [Prunus persica]|uniref:Uncharacterized protein n=1 Tax=Prunus persica TaxID=3760 RepID=A0A251NIM3_PRUPE|nr:hypothetical protein PRUPE_6G015800 [Prunus persica]
MKNHMHNEQTHICECLCMYSSTVCLCLELCMQIILLFMTVKHTELVMHLRHSLVVTCLKITISCSLQQHTMV